MSDLEFSTALAAALSLNGYPQTSTVVSDHDLPRFHEAFREAYKVIEDAFSERVLRFNLILHEFHGTTPTVTTITDWWLSSKWATRDMPGTCWRIWIDPEIAERLLSEEFPGGTELWQHAATAFLKHLRS